MVRRERKPSLRSFSTALSYLSEAISEFIDEEPRLLEGREMTALVELVPVYQLWRAPFSPASRCLIDFSRKHAVATWHGNGFRNHEGVLETLPIELRRRGAAVGKPIHHDAVEQLIIAQDVERIAIAIGPCPELFEYPGCLSDRRVC